MILPEIERYLSQHGRAALADLSQHLHVEPEALRGMLRVLQRKGRVRKLQAQTLCGGCTKCSPTNTEVFEWAGEE